MNLRIGFDRQVYLQTISGRIPQPVQVELAAGRVMIDRATVVAWLYTTPEMGSRYIIGALTTEHETRGGQRTLYYRKSPRSRSWTAASGSWTEEDLVAMTDV